MFVLVQAYLASYELEGFLLAQGYFNKWRADRVGNRRV